MARNGNGGAQDMRRGRPLWVSPEGDIEVVEETPPEQAAAAPGSPPDQALVPATTRQRTKLKDEEFASPGAQKG